MMKEERLKETSSEILEEQDDNLDEDENEVKENADFLLLDGIDKILEGGSVVLTLKDQDILLANNGDLNEDVDMLENVEITEQKQRIQVYKAAKKMLPQYDDPPEEEEVVLDSAGRFSGRFSGEEKKKLEELRRRLQGPPMNNQAVRISSEYYTREEMLKFRKPRKKKSLRRKEKKLDLDVLEAEARITGLGVSDLGSHGDRKRKVANKEEEERYEVERRKSNFQAAFSKANEASRALRMEHQDVNHPANEENDTLVFAEDLQNSMERTLKKTKYRETGKWDETVKRRSEGCNQTEKLNLDLDHGTPKKPSNLLSNWRTGFNLSL